MRLIYLLAVLTRYQILAHFADRFAVGIFSKIRRRFAKLAAKNVGEMAVTGKPEVERDRCQVRVRRCDQLQRCPQTQQRQVSMYGQARLLLKDAGKIEWRSIDRGRDIVERYRFCHVCR